MLRYCIFIKIKYVKKKNLKKDLKTEPVYSILPVRAKAVRSMRIPPVTNLTRSVYYVGASCVVTRNVMTSERSLCVCFNGGTHTEYFQNTFVAKGNFY